MRLPMSSFMPDLLNFNSDSSHYETTSSPVLTEGVFGPPGLQALDIPFNQSIFSDPAYRFSFLHGYHQDLAHNVSDSGLPFLSNETSPQTAADTTSVIDPLRLDTCEVSKPRTTFEDLRKACQYLNTSQQLVNLDADSPAYYLQGNLRSPDHCQFTSTSERNDFQNTLYGNASCSNSVSPTGANDSPGFAWSPSPSMTAECLCLDEDRNLGKGELEEDDSSYDKPYARLIYEALMQAPRHRMMLREIYSWFQRHTNKAKDSSSNGWQNSIRHNLSMNQVCGPNLYSSPIFKEYKTNAELQAFQNDKTDTSTQRGQTKKANSVWVLTENAIKNGVQSTTRYRKTGSGKKAPGSRTPAPLRQRSGARGGRAARRAAKLRRNEHCHQPDRLSFTNFATPPDAYLGIHARPCDVDYISVCTPTTPTNNPSFGLSSATNVSAYPTELPLYYTSTGGEFIDDITSIHRELPLHPKTDPCIEEMENFHYVSTLHAMSM